MYNRLPRRSPAGRAARGRAPVAARLLVLVLAGMVTFPFYLAVASYLVGSEPALIAWIGAAALGGLAGLACGVLLGR